MSTCLSLRLLTRRLRRATSFRLARDDLAKSGSEHETSDGTLILRCGWGEWSLPLGVGEMGEVVWVRFEVGEAGVK